MHNLLSGCASPFSEDFDGQWQMFADEIYSGYSFSDWHKEQVRDALFNWVIHEFKHRLIGNRPLGAVVAKGAIKRNGQ